MVIAGSSQQQILGIFIFLKLAMPKIRSSELVRNQKAEAWISQKRKMGNNTDSWISDAQKSFLWSRCNQSQGDFKPARYRSVLYHQTLPRLCGTASTYTRNSWKKTLPCLCGTASFRSCWVLHSTGGMSVKGGVAGEADPWRTIPSCAREKGWVPRQRSCRGMIWFDLFFVLCVLLFVAHTEDIRPCETQMCIGMKQLFPALIPI